MDSKKDILDKTLWVAHSLFDRNRTTGSCANISFRYENHIFISKSGSSFGRITESDFVETDLGGNIISGGKPSKELPIHLAFYKKNEQNQSVIHTHGPYVKANPSLAYPSVGDSYAWPLCFPAVLPYGSGSG